mgnify:CR=1 FL=1
MGMVGALGRYVWKWKHPQGAYPRGRACAATAGRRQNRNTSICIGDHSSDSGACAYAAQPADKSQGWHSAAFFSAMGPCNGQMHKVRMALRAFHTLHLYIVAPFWVKNAATSLPVTCPSNSWIISNTSFNTTDYSFLIIITLRFLVSKFTKIRLDNFGVGRNSRRQPFGDFRAMVQAGDLIGQAHNHPHMVFND